MQDSNTYMKAPAHTSSANIDGHSYQVPQKGTDAGVIKVINPGHVETLRRHGFVDYFPKQEDAEDLIDKMDDKEELVKFIEERGGEADDSMGLKKLRRLAKESLED